MKYYFKPLISLIVSIGVLTSLNAGSAKITFNSPSVFTNNGSLLKVKWTSENKPEFETVNKQKTLRNLFGHLSASVKTELSEELQSKNWTIKFSWAPYNSSFAWPRGCLLRLDTKDGELSFETLRRGRLGIRLNGKLQACTPWLNWNHKTLKELTLLRAKDSILLFINGKLKLHTELKGNLTFKSLNLGTPKDEPLLCSGGFWRSLEIGNTSEYELIEKEKKSLESTPYAFKELQGRSDLVKRLEKIRTISPDDISDKKLKADLSVLQISWDAWLSRMSCRDWDKWESKNPGSKDFFKTALSQMTKMADLLEAKRDKYKSSTTKEDKKTQTKGPWRIRNGKIYRNETSSLYQGFIGWTLGSATSDIADMGGNLVSISVWPEQLYDNEGGFCEDKWQEVVARTMAVAESRNIAVDVLITAYPTKSLLKANPQWEKTCGHSFLKACVLDEVYKKFSSDFLRDSLRRLKTYPAFVSVCLGNELQFDEHCEKAQKRFQKILEDEFKTVDAFNRRFGTEFRTFSEIKVSKEDIHKPNMPKWVTYWRRNMWSIGDDYTAELVDICRKEAPGLPLHIKMLPNEFTRPSLKPGSWAWEWKWKHWDFPDGIDRPGLVNILDMAGTDSWAASIRKSMNDDFVSELNVMYQQMYYDYLTCLNPGKPIFDSEWHVLNGHKPMPPEQYRSTVWLGVTGGVQAASLWVWHPTIERLTALTQPATLNEVSRFFLEIQERSDFVNELRENRFAPIALIYDHDLCRSNQNGYITAMLSTYRQLLFMGRRPLIIDTRTLEKRALPEGLKAVIVIKPPNQTVLKKDIKNVPAIHITWPEKWEGALEIIPQKTVLDAREIFNSEKEDQFNSELFKAVSVLCPGIKGYTPVHGVVPLKDSEGKVRMLINITMEEKKVSMKNIKVKSFEVRFIEK